MSKHIRSQAIQIIKEHAGYTSIINSEKSVYIGFGHDISVVPIPEHIAHDLLIYDLGYCHKSLKEQSWYSSLTLARQDVFILLGYFFSIETVLELDSIIKAVTLKRFDIAAYELYNLAFSKDHYRLIKKLSPILKKGRYK